MRMAALNRFRLVACLVVLCQLGIWVPGAFAIPSFMSIDSRLPNPSRPYEMTGGTVDYSPLQFSLYDLTFQPSDPSQLSTPSLRSDFRFEFDSTFDITYEAVISFGTGPVHTVSGPGKARATGISRENAGPTGGFIYRPLQIFDTELLSLNLYGLSPIPEFMFRESPTLPSTGVTIRENSCPVCATAYPIWRISSFFDIASEVTASGGNAWNAASDFIHVEQAPGGFSAGDYNQDHSVDTADYILWRRTLGRSGAGLAADGDWSGMVDAGDYDVWRANVGGATSGGGMGGGAIPEPSSITHLLVCLVSMAGRRRSGNAQLSLISRS